MGSAGRNVIIGPVCNGPRRAPGVIGIGNGLAAGGAVFPLTNHNGKIAAEAFQNISQRAVVFTVKSV